MNTRCGSFPPATSRSRKWLWRLCTIPVCALALAAAVSFAVVEPDWEAFAKFPGGPVLLDSAGATVRVVLDGDGTDCRPSYVASPDDWIVKALVASEDGRFWSHCGVRVESIARAACQNVFHRRRVSGASTITMQAVRLAKPHRKNYFEKWVEAVKALKVERRRDKLWIVSQYLNRAPFGSNFVGIEAAAGGWFGKSAKALGPGEAALLAGMVQAPSRYRPDRFPLAALARRDYVLGRMKKLGYIDEAGFDAARRVQPRLAPSPRPFFAPHYCDWYLEDARPPAGVVTTHLDARIQRICEAAVRDAARKNGCRASAVVVDVATGDVVALAESVRWGDGPDESMFVTAKAARPAGSTLKPLLCALAFDAAVATPRTRLKDVPMPRKGYNPANFDGVQRGPVPLDEALVLSLNLPFVRLLERIGVGRFASFLRSCGFAHLDSDDGRLGLGLAIGNAEITLVELARAYAALAGGRSGSSREAAWLVSEILSSGTRGIAASGHRAEVKAPRFAWKTGTSSAYRDAWTVAWNAQYCVAVWCGYLSGGFDDKALTGSLAAAPAALEIARGIYPSGSGPWFERPAGVVERRVCSTTGESAGAFCPETEMDFAIAARSSLAPCSLHRAGMSPEEAAAAKLPADALSVASPQSGAVYCKVPYMEGQFVSMRCAGNPPGGKVWWFVDGRCIGSTQGNEPLAVDIAGIPEGEHVVVCASMEETSAGVVFTVK